MSDPAEMHLPCAGGFDWPAALEFLSRRAIAGVESVAGGRYTRSIRVGGAVATMTVGQEAGGGGLAVAVSDESLGPVVAARVRWMFDLDADLATINAHLSRDPSMAPLVSARPHLRVFHGWDGFEVAMRSVIGQQVSVGRARDLNGVLVERCGAGSSTSRLFPGPREVVDTDLGRLGMPGARVAALKAVAHAALEDPALFTSRGSIEATTARLRAIKGIGDWTAHYIAMRACGEPDAFPASDVGLLRGAAGPGGRRPSPGELLARAEAWRPWRAYAAHQLWASDPL